MKPPFYLCMAACCLALVSCSVQEAPKPFCRNGYADQEHRRRPVHTFPKIHLIKPPATSFRLVSFGQPKAMPKFRYQRRRNTRKGSIRHKGEINPFKSKPKGKQF